MEENNINKTESKEPEDIHAGRSRKAKRKTGLVIGIAAAVVVVAAAAVFGYSFYRQAQPYNYVFFNGTVINGINASGRTPEEIKNEIADKCKDYVYTVKCPGRDDEQITAGEVGLRFATDDTVDKILASQNIYKWKQENALSHEYTIAASTVLDETLLKDRCINLKAFDDASAVKPVDARLGEYDPELGEYPVQPEVNGTVITDKDAVINKIREDMLTLAESVDLGEMDIFEKAKVTSDSEEIISKKEALDAFVKPVITYKERNFKLDGKLLSRWAKIDADNNVTFDEKNVRDFVEAVANSYDTLDKPRLYHTGFGKSVFVEGGNYGWKVDRDKEYETVLDMVKNGKSQSDREPEWTDKAKSLKEGNDLGDNYVEVNLTKQVLNYYKDGKVFITTDVVSGNINLKGRATPTGTWYIYLKQKDRTLRGPRRPDGTYDYESHVNFWMPFIYGYGLHDATWRGSFGGEIYKSNGSHGCVNLPYKIAQQLYDEIEVGTPVILYFEPENGSNTSKTYEAVQGGVSNYVPPAQPETPAETAPEAPAEAGPGPNPLAGTVPDPPNPMGE